VDIPSSSAAASSSLVMNLSLTLIFSMMTPSFQATLDIP